MRGRAYQWFEDVQTPPGRIEIRVSPNFGQGYGCGYGQWVAFLYEEDGTPAGRDCCSGSIEGAKLDGLRRAHYLMIPPPIDRMRRISEERWPEIELKKST
jgi:hypothetical protein